MTAITYGMWMLRLQREEEELRLAEQQEASDSTENTALVREGSPKRILCSLS